MRHLYQQFYLVMLVCLVLFATTAISMRHGIGGVPDYAWNYIFIALAMLISIGAYPLARQLTKRLERLQQAVESLGEGDLSARVAVEGRDEIALVAQSFNRAAERIESLVQAHKSLLSNASHELRTPLTRIQLTVALMKQTAEPKRKAELDKDIEELDQLIDEILLASRLDAAPPQSNNEEIDLLALAAEECARYTQVELRGKPLILHGQARLLRRMLRNLLENAYRHGQPPVQMQIVGQAPMAQIIISDTGPGIDTAYQERIFEPFFRSPHSRSETGTGLGLALVRQIARLHGGDARCEQIMNGHSQFIVEILCAQPCGSALPHTMLPFSARNLDKS